MTRVSFGKKSGFTLVELSIVLVILGLLIGGVLTGQSLIRAAELRAVVAEAQRFQTATYTFRDKYMALPGDMQNATAFWFKDNTNCSSHTGTAGSPGVCNGDGNGIVSTPLTAGGTGEIFQFWRHLASAGLMEGTYSGLSGASTPWGAVIRTAAQNSPPSKIGSSVWQVQHRSMTAHPTIWDGEHGLYFLVAGYDPNTAADLNPGVLRAEEAYNIDVKTDDGKPAYGRTVSIGSRGACVVPDSGAISSSNFAVSYNLQNTAAICGVMFRNVL